MYTGDDTEPHVKENYVSYFSRSLLAYFSITVMSLFMMLMLEVTYDLIPARGTAPRLGFSFIGTTLL